METGSETRVELPELVSCQQYTVSISLVDQEGEEDGGEERQVVIPCIPTIPDPADSQVKVKHVVCPLVH